MQEINGLSGEDLTNALNNEIANLGGINPEQVVDNQVEEDTQGDERTNTNEDNTVDEGVDDSNENKAEKNFKKLLSQKNKIKQEKLDLEARIKELEKINADNEFYSQNPSAKDYKEQIDELLENRPELNRDEAYILLANSKILEENKRANANNLNIVGKTPSSIKNDKKPSDMSTEELDKHIRELYSSGSISI